MGLEPTTTGITIFGKKRVLARARSANAGNTLPLRVATPLMYSGALPTKLPSQRHLWWSTIGQEPVLANVSFAASKSNHGPAGLHPALGPTL